MRNLKKTTAVDFCDSFVVESGEVWLNRHGTPWADGSINSEGKCAMVGETPLAREVQTRVNKNIADINAVSSSIELTCGRERYRITFGDGEDRTNIRVCLERGDNFNKKRIWRPVVDGLISWSGWIYD